MKLTLSSDSGINSGDIIISSDDNYFNNIVVSATKTTLTTRKIKWYEDTDTVFLAYLVTWSLMGIFLLFLGE